MKRLRPSPSMVVAFIALFMAIGGGSWALAASLPSKSVGAKQLKRGAVRNANLANGAVTGAKVKDRSLTARDINVGSLQGVASAASAATATNATHANAAAAVDKVTYASAQGGVPPANPTTMHSVAGASAACPAGTFAIGGGVGITDAESSSVVDSFPEPGGRAWTGRVDNNDPAAGKAFNVVAICLAAGSAG
jgi:hypothetical protein